MPINTCSDLNNSNPKQGCSGLKLLLISSLQVTVKYSEKYFDCVISQSYNSKPFCCSSVDTKCCAKH